MERADAADPPAQRETATTTAADDDSDDEQLAHVPLLPVTAHPARKPTTAAATRRVQPWKIAAATFTFVMLAIHVLFVVLLRKTTLSLEQLTIPDLCHTQSKGTVVLQFANPSYCSPDVGPLRVVVSKNDTALLELALSRFTLAAGVSTLVADVDFTMLAAPDVLHARVFRDASAFEVAGSVPIRIYCMLVPFTVHVSIKNAVSTTLSSSPPALLSLQLQPRSASVEPLPSIAFTLDPTPEQVLQQQSMPLLAGTGIKDELDRLVKQILGTIALAHVRVESDVEQIFAYTDVSFDYRSRVLWNVPALTVAVRSEVPRERILLAGFTRFLLGNGRTFISVFTDIAKSQAAPLQRMLQQYLGGADVVLHVAGANPTQSCYSLQVLDLVDVAVRVPAKIGGKPALLRHSEVRPTLKQLDSVSRKCLLVLDVRLAINNPLPMRFDLYGIALDLLYKSARHGDKQNATFLLHLDDRNHTAWAPHRENNVTLATEVRAFDACSGVIGLYFQDDLAFEIQHGRLALGVGSGNLTIPFSVKHIDIHPSVSDSVDIRGSDDGGDNAAISMSIVRSEADARASVHEEGNELVAAS